MPTEPSPLELPPDLADAVQEIKDFREKIDREAKVAQLQYRRLVFKHKQTFGTLPLALGMGLTRYRIYQLGTEGEKLAGELGEPWGDDA